MAAADNAHRAFKASLLPFLARYRHPSVIARSVSDVAIRIPKRKRAPEISLRGVFHILFFSTRISLPRKVSRWNSPYSRDAIWGEYRWPASSTVKLVVITMALPAMSR